MNAVYWLTTLIMLAPLRPDVECVSQISCGIMTVFSCCLVRGKSALVLSALSCGEVQEISVEIFRAGRPSLRRQWSLHRTGSGVARMINWIMKSCGFFNEQ